MKWREILLGTLFLALMVLSLFDYSRDTHTATPHGSWSETINLDGASLVAIGLGIAAIFSLRSVTRQFKEVSKQMGLIPRLPRVPYEWLPLALAPFLLIGFSKTITNPLSNGVITITTGFGNSPAKIWMLILLCVVIYLGKLRTRLDQIRGKL